MLPQSAHELKQQIRNDAMQRLETVGVKHSKGLRDLAALLTGYICWLLEIPGQHKSTRSVCLSLRKKNPQFDAIVDDMVTFWIEETNKPAQP